MSWVIKASPVLKIFDPLRRKLEVGDRIHINQRYPMGPNDAISYNEGGDWDEGDNVDALNAGFKWDVVEITDSPHRYIIANGATHVAMDLFDVNGEPNGPFSIEKKLT